MDKQAILHEHNKARQMLALGKVGGQPAAMNMREMIWDDELARIAQRWADQCMPGHDHARNVDRFAVGQNVATTWTYKRKPPNKDAPEFQRHVLGWFDEVNKYKWRSKDISPFNFRMDTGHYTQVSFNDDSHVQNICSWAGPTLLWLDVAMLTMTTQREVSVSFTCVTMVQEET